jgi:zinc/manganese transport system substrate-binding protein/manganese/iron transport system substrate-binding protein
MRPGRNSFAFGSSALRAAGLFVATAFLAAACSGRPGASEAGSGLRVVATTTVFADLVRQVGGPRVSVASIVPAGTGPEDYEPRTEDSKRLADAQLVVSNGVGLDGFLEGLISTTATKATRLVLGEGIPAIETEGQPNPHFWLDPSIVVEHYLPKIATTLTELDPAGKAAFEENAAAYARQLQELDASLKAKVAEIPPGQRKLVTFHDGFPYFARHFGFQLIGVIVDNVGQEPSAGELAQLIDKVKAAQVRAVFSEVQFSPKLAQTLAEEAGVQKVVTTLYNDSLGPAPADSYAGMMRWNVDRVVEALR